MTTKEATAQTPARRRTTKGLSPKFLDEFSHKWMDAWNRHDGAAVAALCTEDVIYDDPALPQTARGRAEVAEFVESLVRAFPDMRFTEPEPAYPSKHMHKAIAPWHFAGTHQGELDPPGFAPSGARIEIDGVDHWWFRDGLVARYRADYDLMQVARAIGAMPEPGTRMERVGVQLQRLQARTSNRRFTRH
jgi:steroid delta-isomerase-like uncharacterized protein